MVSLRGKRFVALLATPVLVTLALALSAGCSSSGSSNGATTTSCSTTGCTVTFDQGVNAEASVLGVKAKLVDVQGTRVTAEVAGQRVVIAAGLPVTVGQLQVSVQKITSSQVTLRITPA